MRRGHCPAWGQDPGPVLGSAAQCGLEIVEHVLASLLREHDHATTDDGLLAHCGVAVVDLVDRDVTIDHRREVEPAGEIELDVVRKVDAEPAGAHKGALEMALAPRERA